MAVLPIEVIETIIDHLSHDHRALARCALVSRTWVPCARFHHFRHLELLFRPSDDHARNFMHICSNQLATIPRSGPRKVSFVATTNVFTEPPKIIREFMVWLRTARAYQSGTMAEVLLGSMRELKVTGMTSTFWPLLADLPSGCFLRTRKFVLSQAVFDSPGGFITLISSLKSLDFLELNFVVFRSSYQVGSEGVSSLNMLRILKVTLGASADLLWIFRPCTTLEELVVEVNKDYSLAYVDSFLAQSLSVKNGTLAHCVLRPDIPRFQRDLRKEINFTRNPGPRFTIEGELSSLLVIFNQFELPSLSHPPSKLTRIVLHDLNVVMYRGRNRLHVFPSFDSWLAKDAFFQSLEEVCFEISETFRKEVLEVAGWNESAMTVEKGSIPHIAMKEKIQEVEELLPKCKGRDLLKAKIAYMTGSH
ncbi:cytoplasmic protein [Moniliophthora roreri MCA 2997]|uniref:Cytoplasmic protein n=2 Tax=Moniliophthora roreri TaxID=221103 RepID=V2XZC1_MONRO|nr:cytoplasmic protein [Moniliophthora roreri MCA 2997]KAI3602669.1 cytoplasmic protein [Moniliophthora roreri]